MCRSSASPRSASSSAIRPIRSDRRARTTTPRTSATRDWRRRSPRRMRGNRRLRRPRASTTPTSRRSAGRPTAWRTARALSRSSPTRGGSTRARWTASAPRCRTSSIPSTSSTCAAIAGRVANCARRRQAMSSDSVRVRRSPSRSSCATAVSSTPPYHRPAVGRFR